MSSEASTTSSTEQPEEEGIGPLSPAKRRTVQSCYDHAQKLITPGDYDYDYVHTLLGQCVSLDPGNLVYVEAMFENLFRRYKGNKKAPKGSPQKAAFKKLISKKEWRQVLKDGPDVLAGNPWDVAVLRGIAEACEHFHLNEVELRYLKTALDADPKDADVNRHCAKSLARMGQFDMAIACWHRVEEANKGDMEAKKMISTLTVEKARGTKGFEADDEDEKKNDKKAAASSRPAPRPAPASKPAPAPAAKTQEAPEPPKPAEPPPKREIKLTPRQKLEQAIEADPTEINHYLELARLHRTEGRLRDAQYVLEKAQAAGGSGELRVIEALEDVQMAAAREQLAVAEKGSSSWKTEESEKLAQDMRDDVNRLELQIFAARANRHPLDKRIRLELGLRLKRVGNFDEAIEELRNAAEEPSLAAPARLLEGECLQQIKQYGPAMKAYQEAMRGASRDEVRHLALYRAAVLAAGLQKPEPAEKWLAELVAENPEFRDAQARLDKLRSIRDKG